MAKINFTKGEKFYTAEFQINGPTAIHIERNKVGPLYLKQKSVEDGKYDFVKDFGFNRGGDLTIDTAIQGVVYPMWIKIESASEPTLAEMVEGEQSGGGAGTAEYVNDIVTEYWAIDWDKAQELGYDSNDTTLDSYRNRLNAIIGCFCFGRIEAFGNFIGIMPSGGYIAQLPTYIRSFAFAKIKSYEQGLGWVIYNSFEDILSDNSSLNVEGVFTKITKEEFYQGVEEA